MDEKHQNDQHPAPSRPPDGRNLTGWELARAAGLDSRAVVLVEGPSDQEALEALAERRGQSLDAEGVTVISMGGATTIGHFLALLGPNGLNVRLAGLCDAREESDFRRELKLAGLGSSLTRSDMEALGFFVCVPDLEEELIRALGPPTVERVLDEHGDLSAFRTFQTQPAWRNRSSSDQLRRFLGAGSGRKIRYGRLLIEPCEMTRLPRPLEQVLAQF